MNQETVSKLVVQLKRHEGFKSTLYKCPAGYLTIGYGHNCEAHEDVETYLNRSVSEIEASNLLYNDIHDTELCCIKNLKFFSNLSDIQQAVIINMAFNLGTGGLLTFKQMLKNFRLDYKTGIAREMMNSKWFSQVPVRASELMFMVLTEEWL